MKGEFHGVVSRICSEIYQDKRPGGLKPRDIPAIVGNSIGRDEGSISGNDSEGGREVRVNCYPGVSGYGCYETAFLSLLAHMKLFGKDADTLISRRLLRN